VRDGREWDVEMRGRAEGGERLHEIGSLPDLPVSHRVRKQRSASWPGRLADDGTQEIKLALDRQVGWYL
jgi:hypothetical protein